MEIIKLAENLKLDINGDIDNIKYELKKIKMNFFIILILNQLILQLILKF